MTATGSVASRPANREAGCHKRTARAQPSSMPKAGCVPPASLRSRWPRRTGAGTQPMLRPAPPRRHRTLPPPSTLIPKGGFLRHSHGSQPLCRPLPNRGAADAGGSLSQDRLLHRHAGTRRNHPRLTAGRRLGRRFAPDDRRKRALPEARPKAVILRRSRTRGGALRASWSDARARRRRTRTPG
jgi:hypothetical protein